MDKDVEKTLEQNLGKQATKEVKKEIQKEVQKEVDRKVEARVDKVVEARVGKEVETRVAKEVKKERRRIEKEVAQKYASYFYHGTKKSAWIFQREFRRHLHTAITAAFAFLIALSWRTPIQNTVDQLVIQLGLSGKELYVEFISAIIITVIAVLVLMWFTKWDEESPKK